MFVVVPLLSDVGNLFNMVLFTLNVEMFILQKSPGILYEKYTEW